jgi:Tetratricopeptide repeat
MSIIRKEGTMRRRLFLGGYYQSCRKFIGVDHPDTLTAMRSLAKVYESLQRYNDAETLFERVLTAGEKRLGAEHPDTLAVKRDLARIRRP